MLLFNLIKIDVLINIDEVNNTCKCHIVEKCCIIICDEMTTNRTTMHDYDQRNYESKTNGKISLDDFIYELELRNEEMSNEIERRTDSNGHHDQSIHGKNGSNSSQQLHPPTTISNGSSSTPTIQNDHQILLEQLAKKEKDLILAAELGKALLDRNEELTRTNEQINEEYTHNLEVLFYSFSFFSFFIFYYLCY